MLLVAWGRSRDALPLPIPVVFVFGQHAVVVAANQRLAEHQRSARRGRLLAFGVGAVVETQVWPRLGTPESRGR